MKFNKPHFIASASNEAINQAKKLIAKCGDFDSNEADVLVVLGGDGFMLQAIKDYMDKKTPFFGLNYGSIGFLMNSVNEEDMLTRLEPSQSVKVSPLINLFCEVMNNLVLPKSSETIVAVAPEVAPVIISPF